MEPTPDEIITKVNVNRDAIQVLTEAVVRLEKKIDKAIELDAPMREFIADMQTVGRFGAKFRALVGWVVLVAAGCVVLWDSLRDSFK